MKLPNWAYDVVNEMTGQTVLDLVFDLKLVARNLKYNSYEKALLTQGKRGHTGALTGWANFLKPFCTIRVV